MRFDEHSLGLRVLRTMVKSISHHFFRYDQLLKAFAQLFSDLSTHHVTLDRWCLHDKSRKSFRFLFNFFKLVTFCQKCCKLAYFSISVDGFLIPQKSYRERKAASNEKLLW